MNIFRIVCVVIMALGVKSACDSQKHEAKPVDYQAQMQQLSDEFTELEKSGQAAVQNSQGNPAKVLASMEELHAKKETYLRKLEALTPPDKFKELHVVLIEWRNKEQDNEGKMLAGFREYAKSPTKETEAKVEALSQENGAIGSTYEEKTKAIAKKNGFNSVQEFLSKR